MAGEKNTSGSQKKKKKNIFSRIGARLSKWFREMRSELKKVVWPTRKQIINNTVIVFTVMVIVAVIVWGFDELAAQGVKALISLGG
jgi:preprotein translocase subunit SecE